MDDAARRATRQLIDALRARGIRNERVLAAMAQLDRSEFLEGGGRQFAYLDEPLAIGHGQTISQPYVVAFMTEALDLRGEERVLEVGTGSGYQAAVLSLLCEEVYSLEVVPQLFRTAVERLARLGFENVRVRLSSGEFGWPEAAPFDAIVVTAAAPRVPAELVRQLAPGGRLIIPVGEGDVQELILARKNPSTLELDVQRLLPVRFVPFVSAPPSA